MVVGGIGHRGFGVNAMGEGFINVTVSSTADLTINEVWPDGDAPSVITEADVIAVINDTTDKHHIAIDWALPTSLSVYLGATCGCDAATKRHLHGPEESE
jgi:hypothetical protein